jgi:hypothetical protein
MTSLYYKNGEFLEIPAAPYYVTSQDTFMSGWGPCEGKKNICIVPCPDSQTANRVASYVRSRSDQVSVRVVGSKPRNRPGVMYSLLPAWIETSLERLG